MSTKQAECQLSATGLHEGIALAPYAHIMRPAGRTDGTEASDGNAGRPARGAEAGRDDAGHAGAGRAGAGHVGASHAGAAHERTGRAGTGGAAVGRNGASGIGASGAGAARAGAARAGASGAGASGTGANRAGASGAEASGAEASGTGADRAGASGAGAARAGANRYQADRDQAARDQADGAAATFRAAIAEVESGLALVRGLRPELTFEQEPAPRKLAPYAASVTVTVCEADGDVGWGRFVLLYDPVGQRGWGGPFRIIGQIRVDLEPEIAADPLVGEVGWSWLTEALDARAVGYQHASGTVTRVVTEGFGAKQDEPLMTEFELRASWSPAWWQPSGSQVTGGNLAPAQAGAAAKGAGPKGSSPAIPALAGSPATPDLAGSPATPDLAGSPATPDLAGSPATPPMAGSSPTASGQPSELGLDSHVAAWCEALCAAAGLPPLAAEVSALRQPRGRRPR